MKAEAKSQKYYGIYRGEVVQILNNGFCRIRIPDILESIDGNNNTLPPAEPAQTIGGGADTVNGTFTYPALGSIVWCFFEGGNLERPVYFATSNVKSEKWDSVSVMTQSNGNEGNDGMTMIPTGHLINFDKTTIIQNAVVNPSTGEIKGNKIDIIVKTHADQEKMYNDATASMPDPDGFPSPFAASIHMDNVNNILSLSALNTIVMRAPKIVIDSTGFGRPGKIFIISNSIENVPNNGPFRVIGGKVNIDGGKNDIILQTLGDILQLKSTEVEDDSTETESTETESTDNANDIAVW